MSMNHIDDSRVMIPPAQADVLRGGTALIAKPDTLVLSLPVADAGVCYEVWAIRRGFSVCLRDTDADEYVGASIPIFTTEAKAIEFARASHAKASA